MNKLVVLILSSTSCLEAAFGRPRREWMRKNSETRKRLPIDVEDFVGCVLLL